MKAKILFLILIAGLLAVSSCTNPFVERAYYSLDKETSAPETTSVITYTVTFDSGGGSDVPDQPVVEGEKATRPDIPTKFEDGIRLGFVNWYSDEDRSDEYNFDTPVTHEITLYAKWDMITFTVTFESNGGSDIEEVIVGKNGIVCKPEDPTKDGYDFGGWYREGLLDAWDFDTDTVTGNITLYAGWNITDISAVLDYLNSQIRNPAPLRLQLDLGDMTNPNSNWRKLLDILNTAGKYVDLDLSLCTIQNGASTEFNPDSGITTGKDKIVSITLPNVATSIKANISTQNAAFKNFTALKSFTGTGLTSISNYAFCGLTSLTQTTLPEKITSIGNYAFSGCTGLTRITLPIGLDSIGVRAFENCKNLVLITLPIGLDSLPVVPASIGNYAFYDCTGLTRIDLPAGLTSIGNSAFYNCNSLTQITLPSGLTEIGITAFYNCMKLEIVTCLAETPPKLNASSVFGNNPSGQQIKVPAGSVNAYKAAGSWSGLASRISAID